MPRSKKSPELLAEQEKLIETLKFTPRTYKITLWGYGGEVVMGTVDREIYDYFRRRRLDVSNFAWDSDYAEEHNIPEEMWPFPPGSWYECDNMAHVNGVERSSGTLLLEDENGDKVLEMSLDEINGLDGGPEIEFGDEAFIDSEPPGTVVFIGYSNEKGTFFEGEIDLTAPFDITKLTVVIDDIDGSDIIGGLHYNGIDIENWGGDTTGKSSEFGFYVAGTENNGSWERYRNEDDCTYEMTEWFPKKVNPIREGVYEIQGGNKNKYPHTFTTTGKWTGSKWVSVWGGDLAEDIEVKQWRGIAYDPNI